MKIICAWCKKELGEKAPLEDQTESHGQCAECMEAMKEEFRIWILSESKVRGENLWGAAGPGNKPAGRLETGQEPSRRLDLAAG